MAEVNRNTQQHWAMYLLAAWEEDDETEDYAPRSAELFAYDQGDNLFSDAGDSAFNDEQSLSATMSDLFAKDVVNRENASERSSTHTSYAYTLNDKGCKRLQETLGKPDNKPRILGASQQQPTETTVASTATDSASQDVSLDGDVDDIFDDDGMLDIEEEETPTLDVLTDEVLGEVKQNTLRHWTLYLIGELSDPTPKTGMTRLDLYDAQHPNADIFKAPDSMSPTITALMNLGLLQEVDSRDRYTAYDTTELGDKLLTQYGPPTKKQNRHSVENFTRSLPAGKNAVEFFVEGDGSEVEDKVTYRTISVGDDKKPVNTPDEKTETADTDDENDEENGPQIIDSDGFTVDVDVDRETLVKALKNVDEPLVADMLDKSMTDEQASLAIETVIEAISEME